MGSKTDNWTANASRILALGMTILLAASANSATHQVGVQDSFFEPPQLAIDAGDTVSWTEYGGQDHTVTSDDGLFDWVLPFGEVVSYTFMQPGTYAYYCDNHGGPGGEGMSGIIVVSASTANQPPAAPVNQAPVNAATNQPLTVQLRASTFSDPNSQDFHGASQWIIRRASNSQVVFDSGEDAINKTNRTLPGGALEYGTNYSWQVRYKDGRGVWSAYSVSTLFTTLEPVIQAGVGLRASYYNRGVAGLPLVVTTNAVIHFNWGNSRPDRRITADDFSVRWEGSVLPLFTERYDFQFQYRGKARMWVNGQLLIDEQGGCSLPQTRRASSLLVGGQLTAVRIEYTADPVGAQAILRWTSASQPMELVPTTHLFPAP